MPLYLGIPFTILILALSSQLHIGSFSLEWVAAVIGGLWSAAQSKKYLLLRFERIFPLEPLALGVTVALLFPFAFPWFLRLRHRALRGRLPLRTRPSRARIALIAIVLIGGIALQAGYGLLRRTEPFKRIEAGVGELQRVAGGPFQYQVRNGVLTVQVENPKLYETAPLLQRDTAKVIARTAVRMLDDSFGALGRSKPVFSEVEIRFVMTRGVTRTESPAYRFSTTDLRQ